MRWIKTALAIAGAVLLSTLVLLSILIGVVFIPPELDARRIVREAAATGRVDARTWQETLPPRVGQAIVAAEFSNRCWCLIAREEARMVAAMLTRNREEGHLRRMLTEMAVGRMLDERYARDQLVDDYARQAYFGRHSYGVGAGARSWFGKPAADLTVPEAAFLAALLRGPSNYDPARGEAAVERAMRRRTSVLMRMWELGFIDGRQFDAARAAPLRVIVPVAQGSVQ